MISSIRILHFQLSQSSSSTFFIDVSDTGRSDEVFEAVDAADELFEAAIAGEPGCEELNSTQSPSLEVDLVSTLGGKDVTNGI